MLRTILSGALKVAAIVVPLSIAITVILLLVFKSFRSPVATAMLDIFAYVVLGVLLLGASVICLIVIGYKIWRVANKVR